MALHYPKFFNQNSFTIIRENMEKQKKGDPNARPFIYAYQDNILEAMRELDGTAFKVYLFFIFNGNGYTMDYSPRYVSQQTGISRDSAREAIKKMELKGYIVCENIERGLYKFYEKPQPVEKRQLTSSQPPEEQSLPKYSWE